MNPRRKPRTERFRRYDEYKFAKTIGECRDRGGTCADMLEDFLRGVGTFTGENAERLKAEMISEYAEEYAEIQDSKLESQEIREVAMICFNKGWCYGIHEKKENIHIPGRCFYVAKSREWTLVSKELNRILDNWNPC